VTAANENQYDTDLLDALSQPAADLSLDDFNNRRRRGRDEIRSAAIWLTFVTKDIADKIRELARGHRDRQAGRVELGVQTSGDDVNFSGREALQRFRVPAGIRHARQSKGRLPLRKECT
jgi:hypothetical protein